MIVLAGRSVKHNIDNLSTEMATNKNHIERIPKNVDEIHSMDDIVDDLRYLTIGFPEAAVESALHRQIEITPILLNFLDEIIAKYESMEDLYFGHLHALYLLAKFREKEAYPRAIKIMSLPDDWPENILGDTITEDLHNILASLYNGDLASIHTIIEDPKLNTWSRNAALKTLLVLVKEKILERSELILYFKTLFDHLSFENDMDAMTHLVNACCDLYPDELMDQITIAFDRGIVNDSVVDMRWVKSVLLNSREAALEEFLNHKHYSFIDDNVISNMKHWACFFERPEKNVASDFEYHKPDKTSSYNFTHVLPYTRTSPKIGRNDPCSCNSGKKYKKCCFSVTA
jgi:Protein of unknown function (DUF1186)/SEC-C motif